MTEYADHALAELFPLMGDADLAELAADIEANGLRDPIWLYEGKILDGRNRYRACRSADVDPRVEQYKGKDPLGFVLSKNLHRRHLTESQRAMVAARLANLQTPNSNTRESVTAAAGALSVSPRTVDAARTVKADGVPELVKAVESGAVSVSAAAEVAKLPKAEQKKAVKDGTVKEKAKEQREKKKADKPSRAQQSPASPPHDATDKTAEPAKGQEDVTGAADPFDAPAREADPDNPPADSRFMPYALDAADHAKRFLNWIARLRAVRTELRAAFPDRDGILARRIDARGQFDAALGDLIDTLDKNVPTHVCPPCCGTGTDDAGAACKFCDRYGIVDAGHHSGLKARWRRTAARLAKLTADADGGAE